MQLIISVLLGVCLGFYFFKRMFTNIIIARKGRFLYPPFDVYSYKKYVAEKLWSTKKYLSVNITYSDRYPAVDIVAKRGKKTISIKTCIFGDWNAYSSLTIQEVQRFISDSAHYKANELVIYTNGDVAPHVRMFCQEHWVKIMDRYGLGDVIENGKIIAILPEAARLLESSSPSHNVQAGTENAQAQAEDAQNNPRYKKGDDEGYEHYVAYMLKNRKGFDKVEITQPSGDRGADIIAVKDDIKYCIQCKNYSAAVSPDAVREVLASLNYYKADIGMVITNSVMTAEAHELADVNRIRIWERFGIDDMDDTDTKSSSLGSTDSYPNMDDVHINYC